ncbi:MAG: ATP-dependent zinc metalloprotease FtsH [Lachnospiraceae bacterium]|jgi:cell division protease FtsH
MDNNNYNRDPGGGKPGGDRGRDNMNRNNLMVMIVIAFTIVLLIQMMSQSTAMRDEKEISYSEFLQQVEDNEVKSVEFDNDRINITPKKNSDTVSYYTGYIQDDRLYQLLDDHNVEYTQKITEASSYVWSAIFSFVLPIVAMVVVMMLLYRYAMKNGGGSGVMGVGKSNAKMYVQKATGVTFADVAGEDEAKESLSEIVDFLHHPERYTKIGAKLPKGALLVGPPGTGKTLLARAVAGEAHVPFFSLSGSDFVEMFVGVGASRVRDLFKQASQNAPCIIFIDELDAIGKSRDSRYGGNDEREQTLNQLLAEMDGFDPSKGIIILGATNRPEILDKALLRPGRFDRRIVVERPDLKGRIDILKVHAKNVNMDETVDFKEIALATSGAVGSDLANIINEAALMAVRNGRNAVSQKDLFESVEVVIAGKEKKDRVLSAQERRIVSYHEVGHALTAALQKHSEPVQKITIVPRTMGALGYTMQVPEEEKYLMSKEDLETELVTLLGGRAAEELVFDSITTGASNDIERATNIAKAMITQYGMSDKFGLMSLSTVEDQYLGGRNVLNCGEETASQIDEEVMKMLRAAYEKSKELLRGHREALDKIAAYLIERETITGKEFMQILEQVEGEDVWKKTTDPEIGKEAQDAVPSDAADAAPEPEAGANRTDEDGAAQAGGTDGWEDVSFHDDTPEQ